MVGAAIAAGLARAGVATAVLEARRIAGGATGRSLGLVRIGLAAPYSWAVSVYGRQRAREVWALSAGGRERLVEAALDLGVRVEESGSLALASDDEEAELLWESAKLLREDGFRVSFSLTDPLSRGFRAVLRSPEDVLVDAAGLARALLKASGVAVHEGSEVYGLEPISNGVRVWSRVRTITCRAVVVAVNGYAPLIDPHLAEHVRPSRWYVLAAEPSDGLVLRAPCTVDRGRGILRALPDGRLLIGLGADQGLPSHEDLLQHPTFALLSHHFPELELRRADRWSEVAGFTPDGLPLLGRLPGVEDAYYAVGFNGRGLSWAFVAADRVVKMILGEDSPGLLSASRLP